MTWRSLHPTRQRALLMQRNELEAEKKRRNQAAAHKRSSAFIHRVQKSITKAARTMRRRRHAPQASNHRHFAFNEFVKHERVMALLSDLGKKWNTIEWKAFRKTLQNKWVHDFAPAQRSHWSHIALQGRRDKVAQPAPAQDEPCPSQPLLWGMMSETSPLAHGKLVQCMLQLANGHSGHGVLADGGARPGLRVLAEESVAATRDRLGRNSPWAYCTVPEDKPVGFQKQQ